MGVDDAEKRIFMALSGPELCPFCHPICRQSLLSTALPYTVKLV
jgi:hypothetical protein